MKKSILGVLVAIGLTLVLFLSPAQAIVIDFGDGGVDGGIIQFLTGNNASGAGIPITVLNVSGTPSKDGIYSVSGVLNFNTSTNFIEVVGTIPALNITQSITLLDGTFKDFIVVSPVGLVYGTGNDEKSEVLLRELGIPSVVDWTYFGFSTASAPQTDGTYIAVSTDVHNSNVPEPATMLLLGSGLVGLAGFARKKFKK